MTLGEKATLLITGYVSRSMMNDNMIANMQPETTPTALRVSPASFPRMPPSSCKPIPHQVSETMTSMPLTLLYSDVQLKAINNKSI